MAKVAMLQRTTKGGMLACAEDPVLDLVLRAKPAMNVQFLSDTLRSFDAHGYLELVKVLDSLGYISVSRDFGLPLPGEHCLMWADIFLSEFDASMAGNIVEALEVLFTEHELDTSYTTALKAALAKLGEESSDSPTHSNPEQNPPSWLSEITRCSRATSWLGLRVLRLRDL